MNVLDVYPGDPGPLGLEFAGVVTRVGSAVDSVAVGYEVMGYAKHSFSNYIVTTPIDIVKKPRTLSMEESSAIPIVYSTAYYGLHTCCKIKPGDKVLIHAASGGVGSSAVQMAKAMGCTVFGTASLHKHDYIRSLGVDHSMNSRTLDFADEIMRLTNGQGVDIVLNSLANDFIPKTFGVLAKNGRFIEIGKTGIWSNDKVAMERPDCSYFLFDLMDVIRDQSQLSNQILRNLVSMVDDPKQRLGAVPVCVFPR